VQIRRTRLIGLSLFGVLALAIAASRYTLAHPQIPGWLASALLPGFFVNLVLTGGALHDVDAGSTAFLNIAVWAFLLGAPAVFLLTVDHE
jgi:hypothetical protein